MSIQNNGESHVKILTDVCQNVCNFINTITEDNMSKDEKINMLGTKVDDLQSLCLNLKTKLDQINELVKTLANCLDFATNQDDVAIDVLTRWVSSLSKKKQVECTKKRKLFSSYSPLKLSLKEKSEINETENKPKCTKFDKENKMSSKKNWNLQIKRDGNPSDLLNKCKQTVLTFQPQEEKVKMDITSLCSSTPKISVFNSSSIFSPEVIDASKIICENNLTNETQINDSCNISVSHFNKIIKPSKNNKLYKNALPIVKTNIFKSNKPNTSLDEIEKYDQSCDEITFISPINSSMSVLNNAIASKKESKAPNRNVLDSFDIIPGLNDKKNELPNYKFKEDPVRKHNERKLLNGWDCEECCKFYEANNDNPVEAKNAMNHFSRHRSVKHQHHAPTPPGFWDPV